MQLYNKLSAKERAALIDEAGKDRLTISFYQYHKIDNPQIFRDHLFLNWDKINVLGRIYVSYEGINAQLSVPAENFEAFKEHLDSISFLNGVRLNIAVEQDNKSFLKLKVKVRNKIVADGLNDDTFDVTDKGIHLGAKEFNAMLADPKTVCVDMRNHYESEIGHFEGAVTPDVDTFRDSLDIIEEDLKDHKEDKNLLMYCTGGIRCEKASAYYKHKGFKNVFQLEGGIIEYTRQVKSEGIENKFIGKNFVFDHRRAERISDDVVANCHQCGKPCDTHVNCANEACHLLFIQCDECSEKMENTCSTDCQDIKKIYRKASQKDIDIWQKVRDKELETQTRGREIISRLGLKMKLSDVEYQGDGNKATFYYTADARVDFRQLIRDLAGAFSIRVEMKQVGARQEAARLGGVGSCGRELCCSTWLTDFRKVTTTAARYQQLSLNPLKLAGHRQHTP